MRLCWLVPLVGCAWLTTGCDAPRSRAYAVTLLDSNTIECLGHPQDLLADPDHLDEVAKDLKKEWKERHLTNPSVPIAKLLRVNELETRMQAWFDPTADHVTQHPASDAGVSDAGVAATPDGSDPQLPYRYDDPGVVYEGELRDGYVDGAYADQFNTDETDEEQGMDLCGLRTRARGTLTITTDGGALGRVRWVHVLYVASDYSACAGRVECVRDIGIEGLETN